ncbi:hypothetical protein E4U42_000600 [Claviceps africana]|uniref:Nascent polypeptide-associated complex subunit alpha-like UBA domain-containing protein n=1 Tax=Claviceps africana TaxID=83212 RepID=A0A8K0J9V8_9HYPO|nr:hypothetical protein E4U42_000600 [Claviceps africana]
MVQEHQATPARDQDDEGHATAKSAEDRKAASALASLDAAGQDETTGEVDREAVTQAMKSLGGTRPGVVKAQAKNIRVDEADVALLVSELEVPKGKATELLRAHDGDAVGAMRAWVRA